jgi:predicted small secreted protein
MKLIWSIVLLAALSLLNSACVSRTVTTEKGFGDDTTKKKIVWIWQDEYRYK